MCALIYLVSSNHHDHQHHFPLFLFSCCNNRKLPDSTDRWKNEDFLIRKQDHFSELSWLMEGRAANFHEGRESRWDLIFHQMLHPYDSSLKENTHFPGEDTLVSTGQVSLLANFSPPLSDGWEASLAPRSQQKIKFCSMNLNTPNHLNARYWDRQVTSFEPRKFVFPRRWCRNQVHASRLPGRPTSCNSTRPIFGTF